MKQSQHFLENAENCAQLAERASDDPTHRRYKRMEEAWRALAEEQDWLDGVLPAHLMAQEKSPPRAVAITAFPATRIERSVRHLPAFNDDILDRSEAEKAQNRTLRLRE